MNKTVDLFTRCRNAIRELAWSATPHLTAKQIRAYCDLADEIDAHLPELIDNETIDDLIDVFGPIDEEE